MLPTDSAEEAEIRDTADWKSMRVKLRRVRGEHCELGGLAIFQNGRFGEGLAQVQTSLKQPVRP
jgi:hypothetical protein